MADSAQFDVIIDVITKNLAQAKKELSGLTQEAAKSTKAHKDAGAAAAEHDYKLNQGITGSSSAAKSFSKLSQTIGSGPNGLVGAYATLAANAFAVSAAFNQLRAAAQVEQVLAGLEAQGARLGQTLTITSKKIQEITNFSVSAADAMKATAQASASGIKSDALQKMAQVATNASIALGRNVPDALDRIIKGTSKLEPELLDELGIMVKLDEASAKYANSLGKPVTALTRFQKSQAFANAVVAEGEAKFGGLSDSVDTNIYDRLSATFENLVTNTLRWVNSLGMLRSVVEALASNPVLLGSTLLVFVSSITKALVPSLYSMAEASARTAAIAEKNIEAKLKEIDANQALVASEHSLAVARAASSANVDAKVAPKKVKEFFSSAQNGGASEAEYASAQKSLKLSGTIAENKIKKLEEVRVAQGSLTEAEEKNLALQKSRLEANQRYAASLDKVMLAQKGLSAAEGEAVAKTALLNLEKGVSEATANRALKEAQALTALSSSNQINYFAKVKQAAAGGKEAVLAFKAEIEAANAVRMEKASGGISRFFANTVAQAAGARTALYSVQLGFRMLSVGILEVVPQIAMAILVITTLIEVGKAVWEWLNPPTELSKRLKELNEDFKSISETASKTGEYTSKLFGELDGKNQGDTGFATKEAAAFKALSNSINEVVDKYKEIRDLRSAGKNTGASFDGTSFEDQLKSVSNKKVQDSTAFKAVVDMTKYGYKPLTEAIVKATIESNEYKAAAGNSAKQMQILNKSLEESQDKYGSVGSTIEDLSKSYSDLDKAVGSFIQNATVKTPYDGLSESLTKIAASVFSLTGQFYNMDAEFYKSEARVKEFYAQLANMSNRALSVMSANTQKQALALVSLRRDLDAASARGDDRGMNLAGNKIRAVSKEYNASLNNDLIVQQAKYAEMQKQYILTEGMIKLENARFSKASDLLKNSVAGREAEYAHQDKIAGIQRANLTNQVHVLENLNLQAVLARQLTEEAQRKLDIERSSMALLLNRKKADFESTPGLALNKELFDSYLMNAKAIKDFNDGEGKYLQQKAELSASILTSKADEAKLGNAILSQKQEIAALDAAQLTAGERAAELLGQQRTTYADLAKKQGEMQSKAYDLQQKLNSLQLSSSNKLLINIKNQSLAYQSQYITLEKAHKAQLDQLQTQIDKTRASASIDEATKKSLITLTEAHKKQLVDQFNLEVKILDTNRVINLVESAKIDIYKEGIELQQQSMSVAQKQADLFKGLIDQQREIALAQAKLASTKLGVEFDSNSKAAKAIEYAAAQKEYNLAASTFQMRMNAIDAEYDLLEAQRQVTVADLKMRSALLEQTYKAQEGGMTSSQQTALNQIRTAADNYSKQTYDSARALAKAQESNNLTLVRLKAEQAKVDYETPINGIKSQVNDVFAAVDQIEAIFGAKKDTNTTYDPMKTGYESPSMDTLSNTLETNLDSFTSELKNTTLKLPELSSTVEALNISFNELIIALKGIKEIAANAPLEKVSQVSTLANKSAAVDQAEKMAKAIGAVVSERGAKTGHKGAGHADDRAIDINAPGYVEESKNPEWKAKFDKLAEDYVKKGYIVLWNKVRYSLDSLGNVTTSAITGTEGTDPKHTRHLHVEAAKGQVYGQKAPSVVSRAAPETPVATPRVQEESPTVSIVRDKLPSPLGAEKPLDVSSALPKLDDILKNPIPTLDLKQQQTSIKDFFIAAEIAAQPFYKELAKLGPEGELVVAISQGMTTIGSSVTNLAESMKSGSVSMKDIANVASAALSTISSVVTASANVKTAAIDKEIAAEQKRDGKSAESVNKINAMQKKKDDIQRKAFNVNKKIMMAQAVIATALGIAQALALGPIAGPILAAMIGALGAAQIAIIAGTQYESSNTGQSVSIPDTLTIGNRSNPTVDLAKGSNANAGGEASYVRGASGYGSDASNYRTVGSAYGGDPFRGYGNRGFVVGEKGPEVISPDTPINVTPAGDSQGQAPIDATIHINAIDAQGVQEVLLQQKGNLIKMLRDAANASGQKFMENVNVNVYTRPSVGKL